MDSLRHASASLAEIARRVGDHASVPGSTLAAQTRSASLAALARAKSLVAALRERASKAEAEAEVNWLFRGLATDSGETTSVGASSIGPVVG